ncbi:uncharacterized protein AMSG_05825 [Thecamonas trahens ATCC 50062]|uniref:Uncharacterized protein n=1 Tax=Thecamonas trahens ATCC 50062 TaxID=461836 RepID=A0A0L0DCM0_THETB|nr:hypothetical protein AMSG_05825 [Thecamonas trahens ATCC 50062]KNC50062.1 hypothetical protein AMSG_05825 [Thecamonas trahens ATCC 50062]|eukprot:XP_013757227.1 hypothetical protein AMSG_05825 [Thecamonas trahens ATCC 50062]
MTEVLRGTLNNYTLYVFQPEINGFITPIFIADSAASGSPVANPLVLSDTAPGYHFMQIPFPAAIALMEGVLEFAYTTQNATYYQCLDVSVVDPPSPAPPAGDDIVALGMTVIPFSLSAIAAGIVVSSPAPGAPRRTRVHKRTKTRVIDGPDGTKIIKKIIEVVESSDEWGTASSSALNDGSASDSGGTDAAHTSLSQRRSRLRASRSNGLSSTMMDAETRAMATSRYGGSSEVGDSDVPSYDYEEYERAPPHHTRV